MPCIFYTIHVIIPQHWNYWQVRNISDLVTMWCPSGKSWVLDSFRPSTHPDSSSSREMVSTHSLRNTAKSQSLQTPESSIHRLPSNKIESCGSSRVSVDQKLCCYLLDTCRRPTSLPGSEQFSQCTFPLLGDYFVANFSKTISTERKAQKARVEGSFGL